MEKFVHGIALRLALIVPLALSMYGCPRGRGPESAETTTAPMKAESDAAHFYDKYPPAAKSFILGIDESPSRGKTPATHVDPDEGFVVRITEQQIEMVYDETQQFSPGARISRGLEECSADLAAAHAPPGVSNFAELMGGRSDPDPFLVSREEGARIIVSPYPLDDEMAGRIETIFEEIEKGQVTEEDCTSIDELVQLDEKMPVLHYLASGCYQKIGNREKSIKYLEEEILVNPSHAMSHLGIADVLLDMGAEKAAMEEIVKAVYYDPAWDMPGKLLDSAEALACKRRDTLFDPDMFIEVNSKGVVVYAAPQKPPWTGQYARCKAAFRYCPEVRMSFGMKAGAYKISLMEELVCLKLAADAYAGTSEEQQARDPEAELLLAALNEDALVEFALFEVIGRFKPDYMKFLPGNIRLSIMDYIKSLVLRDETGEKRCDLFNE